MSSRSGSATTRPRTVSGQPWTRLLNGEHPACGGKCDIKTLAVTAGVDRTAFYGTRPYAHLRTEFEQRLSEPPRCQENEPDPRDSSRSPASKTRSPG